MLDLRLDTNSHDLTRVNYDLVLVEGVDEVVQHIKQRLWLFRGEWFLDTAAGVPWLQDILKKNPRRYVVEQALKRAIVETPGVDELLAFELEDPGVERTVQMRFRVRAGGQVLTDSVEVSI